MRKQLLDTLKPLREVEESLSQSVNNVIKAESEPSPAEGSDSQNREFF